MKMKKWYAGIAALLVAGTCHAQVAFGVKGGPTFSGVIVKQGQKAQQSKMLMGGTAGMYARLPLAPVLYVQPSLLYEMKGGESKTDNTKTRLGYLTLPIDILLKPYSDMNGWFAGAGPYVGYGISGKTKGGEADTKNIFKDSNGLKRWDAGIHAQAGYEFASGFNIGLQAGLGLLNLQKNGDSHHAFRTISYGLTAGYTFGQ